MALSDLDTSTTMLVQPACGYGYSNGNGNNGGLFGNNNDWLGILFLIALCNGGWGGFGGGFGGGYGMNGAGSVENYTLASDMAQLQKLITDSYSMTERKLDSITNGLCDGFFTTSQQLAGVNSNIANAQYNLANAITVGGYETRNAVQGIGTQLASCCCDIREGIAGVNYNAAMNANALQAQINNCCCDVREGIANVNYTNAMNTNAINQNVSNGFCQTNFNNSNNTRDIITSTHADTDRIIARLDAMETARQAEKIAELQAENQGLKFAASQQAQNAYLIDALGTKCPQPAYVVQPPQQVSFATNCCGGVNYAGGCGCNG